MNELDSMITLSTFKVSSMNSLELMNNNVEHDVSKKWNIFFNVSWTMKNISKNWHVCNDCLTSKGHRLDVRRASELNINLKHLEGQLQTELERLERAQQTAKDFHQLEKEFDTFIKIGTEQLSSQSNDRGIIYQVRSLSSKNDRSDCFSSVKTVFDRLQQSEHELKKMIHLAERLTNEISREHVDELKESIASRQARLQTLFQTCQQARTDYELQIKSEQKLNEELINLQDWLRRLIEDFTQPLELNLSLNHLHDLQQSLTVSHLFLAKDHEEIFVSLCSAINPVHRSTSSTCRSTERSRSTRTSRSDRETQTTSESNHPKRERERDWHSLRCRHRVIWLNNVSCSMISINDSLNTFNWPLMWRAASSKREGIRIVSICRVVLQWRRLETCSILRWIQSSSVGWLWKRIPRTSSFFTLIVNFVWEIESSRDLHSTELSSGGDPSIGGNISNASAKQCSRSVWESAASSSSDIGRSRDTSSSTSRRTRRDPIEIPSISIDHHSFPSRSRSTSSADRQDSGCKTCSFSPDDDVLICVFVGDRSSVGRNGFDLFCSAILVAWFEEVSGRVEFGRDRSSIERFGQFNGTCSQ